MEGIRICRRGYPNRVLFIEFFNRYKVLCFNLLEKLQLSNEKINGYTLLNEDQERSVVQEMLKYFQIDNDRFKIGKTKLFCRVGLITEVGFLKNF